MIRTKEIINNIPNLVTLLNLLSGCLAVIFSFHAYEEIRGYLGWQWASIMICAAALFDFLDGAVARLLRAKSIIGKELDSLSDMVSFGIAPAMLLINVLLSTQAGMWSYSALFLPLMGAMRLAKFNVDATQTTEFKGLPIPANAIFWIGIVSAMYYGHFTPSLNVMLVMILAMGLLMVCRMRMFSLKFSSFRLRENMLRYVLIISTAILFFTIGVAGFSIGVVLYIILSALRYVIKVTY